MRGVVATFDADAGIGTIRGRDGKIYSFTRKNIVRRSREPYPAARVVFRLRNGEISKAVVVRDEDYDGWTIADFFCEVLLYFPIP